MVLFTDDSYRLSFSWDRSCIGAGSSSAALDYCDKEVDYLLTVFKHQCHSVSPTIVILWSKNSLRLWFCLAWNCKTTTSFFDDWKRRHLVIGCRILGLGLGLLLASIVWRMGSILASSWSSVYGGIDLCGSPSRHRYFDAGKHRSCIYSWAADGLTSWCFSQVVSIVLPNVFADRQSKSRRVVIFVEHNLCDISIRPTYVELWCSAEG
jgi:hypothetical protein